MFVRLLQRQCTQRIAHTLQSRSSSAGRSRITSSSSSSSSSLQLRTPNTKPLSTAAKSNGKKIPGKGLPEAPCTSAKLVTGSGSRSNSSGTQQKVPKPGATGGTASRQRRRRPKRRGKASGSGIAVPLGLGMVACATAGATYYYYNNNDDDDENANNDKGGNDHSGKSAAGGSTAKRNEDDVNDETTRGRGRGPAGAGVHNPAKEGAGTFAGFVHQAMDYFRGESGGASEMLLPDYEHSVLYQEGAPPPLTLVVDLEETLGTSTWDRKHGWRFVKRPGLDSFLMTMARFGYEVVIFSTNPSLGAVEDTLALLDPMGQLAPYKLYCNSAKFQDERYVKDLSNLNRDFSRVIVVDDNINDLVTNKENCIPVKPFDDIEDVDDNTLAKLAAFLQYVATLHHSGAVKDVRQELNRFRPKEGEEPVNFLKNFDKHLEKTMAVRKKKQRSGLAGVLRRNTLLRQDQQQQQKQKQQQKQQQRAAPIAAVMGAPGPGMLGVVPVQNTAVAGAKGKSRYRKTIWERMTDPHAAAKQDKELQQKEQQWKKYTAQLQNNK